MHKAHAGALQRTELDWNSKNPKVNTIFQSNYPQIIINRFDCLLKQTYTYKSLVSAILPSLWYGPAGSLNLSNRFDNVSFDTDVKGTLTIPSP